MSRVAVVHHNREIAVGRLKPFLRRHVVVDVWAPDADFPHDIDAAVVMGGFMGAYDTDLHPWLDDEKAWLEKRVSEETPVLGLCLGAQLLADVLGGRAFRAPHPEVGVVRVKLTEAGAAHPVISHLGDRAFFAHQDTFDPPADATLLASTGTYPAAFEVGSALAVQPHPETPLDEALAWAEDPRFDMLDRVGMSRDEYARTLRAHAVEAELAAEAMFGAWFGRLAR